MRILIADKLASEGADYLEGQPDTEVTVRTGLAGDDLAEALREHDGVVVRSAARCGRSPVRVSVSTTSTSRRRPGWGLP